MEFSASHRKYIRTTNQLGPCFEEQNRRTKVIPRFLDAAGCLKLIYSTLIWISETWRKVKISEYELALLEELKVLINLKGEDGFIPKKVAAQFYMKS